MAFGSLRCKRNQYLGLLCSFAGQFDRLNNDFTILVTQARDNRSNLRRGAVPLLEEFPVPADDDDVLKGAPVPAPTDEFLVIYGKLRFGCCYVACHSSLFSFAGVCSFVPILSLTFYLLSRAYHLFS